MKHDPSPILKTHPKARPSARDQKDPGTSAQRRIDLLRKALDRLKEQQHISDSDAHKRYRALDRLEARISHTHVSCRTDHAHSRDILQESWWFKTLSTSKWSDYSFPPNECFFALEQAEAAFRRAEFIYQDISNQHQTLLDQARLLKKSHWRRTGFLARCKQSIDSIHLMTQQLQHEEGLLKRTYASLTDTQDEHPSLFELPKRCIDLATSMLKRAHHARLKTKLEFKKTSASAKKRTAYRIEVLRNLLNKKAPTCFRSISPLQQKRLHNCWPQRGLLSRFKQQRRLFKLKTASCPLPAKVSSAVSSDVCLSEHRVVFSSEREKQVYFSGNFFSALVLRMLSTHSGSLRHRASKCMALSDLSVNNNDQLSTPPRPALVSHFVRPTI